MNLDERRACEGLDDTSIMESMAWLKEQADLLHFEIERASQWAKPIAKLLTDTRGAERLPKGGREP